MKKIHFIFALMGVAIAGYAESLVRPVSMSGTYYTIPNPIGADYIYVFRNANDASFETRSGESAIWTELYTGDTKKNYTAYQSVQDGYCYAVEVDGQRETFVFIDFSKHRLAGIQPSVIVDCSYTDINLPGLLAFDYYTDSLNTATSRYDVKQTLPYSLYVTYNNQQWGETDWQTVEITDTIESTTPETIRLDSLLCDTKMTITENMFSETLFGQADSVGIDTCIAVAVAHHQQYFITKRGKKLENEKEGPYEDQTIIHSAPLEVLFQSNPSAKADVYSWTIRRGNDIRTTRNEKEIRYIFDEASESGPVNYLVDLTVRNSEHPECMAVAQDTITLHSSLILVPNVFTPNGDGKNDEFRVVYRSICDFHCWIYNRWQHLIYSWDDPTKGWDGTVNGRKEPDSAYLYIIEATGCDGQKFKLKGMVNLLRGK